MRSIDLVSLPTQLEAKGHAWEPCGVSGELPGMRGGHGRDVLTSRIRHPWHLAAADVLVDVAELVGLGVDVCSSSGRRVGRSLTSLEAGRAGKTSVRHMHSACFQ